MCACVGGLVIYVAQSQRQHLMKLTVMVRKEQLFSLALLRGPPFLLLLPVAADSFMFLPADFLLRFVCVAEESAKADQTGPRGGDKSAAPLFSSLTLLMSPLLYWDCWATFCSFVSMDLSASIKRKRDQRSEGQAWDSIVRFSVWACVIRPQDVCPIVIWNQCVKYQKEGGALILN